MNVNVRSCRRRCPRQRTAAGARHGAQRRNRHAQKRDKQSFHESEPSFEGTAALSLSRPDLFSSAKFCPISIKCNWGDDYIGVTTLKNTVYTPIAERGFTTIRLPKEERAILRTGQELGLDSRGEPCTFCARFSSSRCSA
jgi:hypothetical protein